MLHKMWTFRVDLLGIPIKILRFVVGIEGQDLGQILRHVFLLDDLHLNGLFELLLVVGEEEGRGFLLIS